MSVLDNFEHWKDFLGDRLHHGQAEGMDENTINEMAYRIGDYLAGEVQPQNEQEELLRQLWNVSSEEEQHALAKMMVKLVQNEGTGNAGNPPLQ